MARVTGGLVVLGVLVTQVGAEPFVAGLEAVEPATVAIALLVVGAATVCSAQRWRLVARGYGVDVPLTTATAAYYRSQFLNSVLPGGVLGDVHRGLAHRALRSVVWERVLAQAVAIALALLVVLVAWPAGSGPSTLVLAALAVAAMASVAVLVVVLTNKFVMEPDVVPAVLGLSVLSAAGHAVVFLVAARAVGVDASTSTLLPIALVVLIAAAVPLHLAGWGPREGAAAWAFAAAGLGAATGASVAVAYGVLALLATLPGAALLVLRRPLQPTTEQPREEVASYG
nr:lysylphosphatidylglycerol synthase domain-containing protein [Nocardioides agariphilus]